MELELLSTSVPPAGVWEIDPLHSRISFSVRHLLVSTVVGSFGAFEAAAELPEDPTGARVQVSIDAGSIDTRVPQRDDHLRSEEFLDTTRHPKITFASKDVLRTPTGWRLLGELTMCGVTRPVDFDLEVLGIVDVGTELRAGLRASARIDRHDFEIGPARSGLQAGALLSDAVDIAVDAQASRRPHTGGGVR